MGYKNTPAVAIAVFAAVAILYFLAFYGLENFRRRQGPWEVTFTASREGEASLVIRQRTLGISNMVVTILGEPTIVAGLPATVHFDRPLTQVPFGKVVYQDPVRLPGVVTFHVLGHEVELMPRTLVLNRREIPWGSVSTNWLKPSDKLAQEILDKRK